MKGEFCVDSSFAMITEMFNIRYDILKKINTIKIQF